jgi:hypothetical protein
MKRQFLLPSALGIVLMLCLLTVQASILRGMSQSVSGGLSRRQTDYTYGFPTMLRITDTETSGSAPVRSLQVYWERIVVVLAIAWCLSMPIGRWVTGYAKCDGEFAGPYRTGWSHPAAIVGYVIGGGAIVGAIAGIVLQPTIGAPVPLAEMIWGFVMILVIFAVPATVIVMIVRRWRHRARAAQRGFAINEVEVLPPARKMGA